MNFFDLAVQNARDEFNAKPKAICAWCPNFDPKDPANIGKSHGMCSACSARLHAEMDLHGGER